MRSASLDADRFKRLGIRSDETWQGGLVRLPVWAPSSGTGEPYRLRGAFWRSTRTGLHWVLPETEPHSADAALAVRALVEFAQKHERELMGRAARLEVTSAEFANELRGLLAGTDITVTVVDHLPHVREELKELARAEEADGDTSSLLDDPTVSLEHLRRFADAAAAFYQAAPWHALEPSDVVAVSGPGLAGDLGAAVVFGAPLDHPSLLVFASVDAEARAREGSDNTHPWEVSFGTVDDMTFGDADLWTDHALAVASPQAYPRPERVLSDDTYARPDAATLEGLAAILRALAESTEDDLDSGQWSRTVTTERGSQTVNLSIPSLLTAIARETDANLSPDAKRAAEQLAVSARQESGRARLRLARQALARSRDCADAWLVLADHCEDAARAIPLYREAIAAATRTDAGGQGDEWSSGAARVHLVARLGLAECLDSTGNVGEAVTHYDALLILDSTDRIGARYSYLIALLDAGRVGEALRLVDRFSTDESLRWQLAGALVLFRCEGASDAARARIDRVLERNRHVAGVLAGTRSVPESSHDTPIAPGSVEEAGQAALWLLEAWEETPGAIEWILARYRARGRGRG